MTDSAQASLQYKFKKIARHQQILLDWQGLIIESTDTIFSTFPHLHRPVAEWSFFVESIFPALHTLSLDSAEIYIERVDSITNTISGLFDCSFMRVEWGDNQHVIVWNVFDSNTELPRLLVQQQRFNEIRLRRSNS